MKEKAEVLKPEVVGHQDTKGNSNLDRSPNLAVNDLSRMDLAGLGKVAHEQAELFNRDQERAAWRALIIGMIGLRAKSMCGHGEFLGWVRDSMPKTYWSMQRFMGLAGSFIRTRRHQLGQKNDPFVLCLPEFASLSKDQARTAPKAVQLAFDFVGEMSLNELLQKYHIKCHHEKPPKPEPEEMTPAELAAWETRHARARWETVNRMLCLGGLTRKDFDQLGDIELENLYRNIFAVGVEMRRVIVARNPKFKV
jgi:hypothetical protein